MSVHYRVLGPLEASAAGRELDLGGPKQRATLALLVLQPNTLVPANRLIDGLWGERPPASAANLVQGYVSGLRKTLGRTAIETRGVGYILHVDKGALDLQEFELLANEGGRHLESGRFDEASRALGGALALWRGAAFADLADESVLDIAITRLEELRVLALERRIEADLARGRHNDVVAEIEFLIAEHPLRERSRGLLMMALYRSGRQAEALDAYRAARATLVDELGIEPGEWLGELHAAILRQDASLTPPHTPDVRHTATRRAILVAVLAPALTETLASIAAPLAREPERELVLVTTVASPGELSEATERLHRHRVRLLERETIVRAAAFTSVAPGVDIANMAREHDVDLLLVDVPDGLLEDARVLALLDRAPCDVGVVVGREGPEGGPVLVPFTGAEHDWAAVELGAWLARSRSVTLQLVGATTGSDGRDASKLLANASIAVQRAFGVVAEPVLVEPTPEALVAAGARAGVAVIGLTDRWRREGLGRARTALATQTTAPTILVRRGVRPGGLAPRGSETRFTWTIAG